MDQSHLTVVETETVQSLRDMFPQHSQSSLMAVIFQCSRNLCTSPDSLLGVCIDFLLDEDDEKLKRFLDPCSWGENPENSNDENMRTENSACHSGFGSTGNMSVLVTDCEKVPEQPIDTRHTVSFGDDDDNDELDKVSVVQKTLSQDGKKEFIEEVASVKSDDSQKSLESGAFVESNDSSNDSLPDLDLGMKPMTQSKSDSSEPLQINKEKSPGLLQDSTSLKMKKSPESSNIVLDRTELFHSILSGLDDVHGEQALKTIKPECSRSSELPTEAICTSTEKTVHSAGQDLTVTSVGSHLKRDIPLRAESQAEDQIVFSCEALPVLSPPRRKHQIFPKSPRQILSAEPELASPHLSSSGTGSATSSMGGGITYLGKRSFSDTAGKVCPRKVLPTIDSVLQHASRKLSCSSATNVQSVGRDEHASSHMKCLGKRSLDRSIPKSVSSESDTSSAGSSRETDLSYKSLHKKCKNPLCAEVPSSSKSGSDMKCLNETSTGRPKPKYLFQKASLDSASGEHSDKPYDAASSSTEPHSASLLCDFHELEESAYRSHCKKMKERKRFATAGKLRHRKLLYSATSGPYIPDRSALLKTLDRVDDDFLSTVDEATDDAGYHEKKSSGTLSLPDATVVATQLRSKQHLHPLCSVVTMPSNSELTVTSCFDSAVSVSGCPSAVRTHSTVTTPCSASQVMNSQSLEAASSSTEPHSASLLCDFRAFEESAYRNHCKKTREGMRLATTGKLRHIKPSSSATSSSYNPDRSILRKTLDRMDDDFLSTVDEATDDAGYHEKKSSGTLSLPEATVVVTQLRSKQHTHPLCSVVTMPSNSELTVTSSFDAAVSVSGRPSAGRTHSTVTTPCSASQVMNSQSLEAEGRELDGQANKVHAVPASGNVNSTLHLDNTHRFTAYREQSRPSTHCCIAERAQATMMTAPNRLDVLIEAALAPEQHHDPEQAGLPMARSAPNLQQVRPILQQPKLFAQPPGSVLMHTKPVLQPPRLRLKPQHVDVQQQLQHQPPPANPDVQAPIFLEDGQDEAVIEIEDRSPSPLMEGGPGVEPMDLLVATPGPSREHPVDLHLAHAGPCTIPPGLEFGVNRVLEVFPAVKRGYVSELLEEFMAQGTLDDALNLTMDRLLQNPHPPQLQQDHQEVTVVHVEQTNTPKDRDLFKFSDASAYPQSMASDRLSAEFRNVRLETINWVVEKCKGHYAPAYLCLKRSLDDLLDKLGGKQNEAQYSRTLGGAGHNTITVIFNEGESNEEKRVWPLMKSLRAFNANRMVVNHPRLNAEIVFVGQQLKQDKEEMDRKIAWQLLESEYEEQGQSIECGCCFTEHPFEKFVQCFEGHLFCCQCLLGYAREAIFGTGKLNLTCMTADCDSTFPKSQLEKALPVDMMQKYEERMTEENLNKAAMEDLVRCPSCNMAVVVDTHVLYFQCPNSICRKEMCRKCKEDWSDHKGKTCDQVEKKDETRLRTSYEEKMTEARVRTCHSCQAQFFKEEGCNKMTCRCGATMCYICRKPQIDYMHFCRHPRDPGKECNECQACSLWSNPDEDEKRAIAEMQKEAQEKRKLQGYQDNKLIGAPDEPDKKRARLH
ncbi:uncharacterized protein LOC143285827 isoform X2 [Babylonia areolata]